MTVQIIRGPLVDAPTPARHFGGLLDVAEVREGMAWMDGNDMFTSWNCNDVKTTDVCATDQTPTKTFVGPVVVDGARFALYLGGQCKPLTEDVESNVARVYDLRESRGVERAFEVLVLGTGSTVSGTPVSAAHALGMMENALADQYAGIGTIHMSPLVATLLLQNQLLVKNGNRFYTQLGTNVVVGTGYTSNIMYGSGDVVVFRGPQVLVDTPDTANNTVNVLAERAYVVVDDCIKLKITNVPTVTRTETTTVPGEPGPAVNVETGTDTVMGPGGSWTPPAGNLRSVTVTVVSGSVEVDGDEFSAPHQVDFDADNNEVLDPPTVTASTTGDLAVVSWVVVS